MKKRLMSLLLAFTMFLTLAMPAMAAAPVKPTAPSWWDEEDYMTFPGDEVYQPENWQKILDMRAQAEAGYIPEVREDWKYYTKQPVWYQDKSFWTHMGLSGTKDPSLGTKYEIALVLVKYAMNDQEQTGKWKAFHAAYLGFGSASSKAYSSKAETQSAEYDALRLWEVRFHVIAGERSSGDSRYLYDNYIAKGRAPEEFFDSRWMDSVPQEKRDLMVSEGIKQHEEAVAKEEAERLRIKIFLDDVECYGLGSKPEINNGRTMIPLRGVAERIGANVDWVAAEHKVVMTRANHTVTMTIGSTTAYVDGVAKEMDVAPYVKDDRTLIPARYMAEFFGQKVGWNPENNRVDITEDFSILGNSNLKTWGGAMGSMIRVLGVGGVCFEPYRGQRKIDVNTQTSTYRYEMARSTLSDSWDIDNREELIETVLSMTDYGHNAVFLELAKSNYADAYTKQIYNKYGNKGILAWDLFRMANVAEWGYEAGYLTYAESLALIQPAAQRLKDNFSSWEQAYENYLYGYYWWAGAGVAGMDIYSTERGKACKNLFKYQAEVFDNSLFNKPIIPVPGVSAEELGKEIK